MEINDQRLQFYILKSQSTTARRCAKFNWREIMNKTFFIAITVSAILTATVTSLALKALGVPEGDLHPIITGSITSAVAVTVGLRYRSKPGEEDSPQA